MPALSLVDDENQWGTQHRPEPSSTHHQLTELSSSMTIDVVNGEYLPQSPVPATSGKHLSVWLSFQPWATTIWQRQDNAPKDLCPQHPMDRT